MTELILHHYDVSPFAEKARLMLGFKRLAWRSVDIPMVMPKPDVVALTGGYRRTPFLQVGADIYCDTARIAQLLETIQPAPTLFPASAPLATALAQWADSSLFFCAVPWAMQSAGIAALLGTTDVDTMRALANDRANMSGTMRRNSLADAGVQLKTHLALLDAQLAQGGPYLFGSQISIADFSVAHALWFIRRAAPVAHVLSAHAVLSAWLDRMLAIGHGAPTTMDSAAAIAVARQATSLAPCAVSAGLGFEAGQALAVSASDYGSDPVRGTLVGLSAQEVVLRRSDERAGTVQVHFPRAGYQIKKDNAP